MFSEGFFWKKDGGFHGFLCDYGEGISLLGCVNSSLGVLPDSGRERAGRSVAVSIVFLARVTSSSDPRIHSFILPACGRKNPASASGHTSTVRTVPSYVLVSFAHYCTVNFY